MTKYKADIADTTASLLSLPDDLEGLVKQVGGVTEVGSNEQKKLESPSQAEKKPQSTSEKKPKTRAKKKERPKLNVEGDDLHVPCRARRRHDSGAEAVDGRLYDHVRYRENCALHPGRQADAQNVPQASHVYAQLGHINTDIVIRLSQAEEQDHRAYRV